MKKKKAKKQSERDYAYAVLAANKLTEKAFREAFPGLDPREEGQYYVPENLIYDDDGIPVHWMTPGWVGVFFNLRN